MEKIIPNTAPDSIILLKKELSDLHTCKNANIIDPFEKLKKLDEKIANESKKIYDLNDKLIKMNDNNKKLSFSQRENIDKQQKLLKILRSKNKSLNKQLNSLSNKQIKLESESLNFGRNVTNPNNEKLIDIKQQKENIQKSINNINIQIQQIHDKEKEVSNKDLLKNFVDNLENIIEKDKTMLPYISMKKSRTGISKSFTEMFKDLEEQEKKNKEMLIQERNDKLKNFRIKELKIVNERKNNIKLLIDNIDKTKTNSNNNSYKIKNYILSEEKEKLRLKNEQELIDIENKKRKDYYSPITAEELNNFSNEVKKNRAKLKLDLEKKKIQMEELWRERKSLLPKYRNKSLEITTATEVENELNQLKAKEEKMKENYLEKINYSKELDNKPKIINQKLKDQREQIIKNLQGVDRQNEIKKLSNKLRLKAIKIVQTQPKNFKRDNILVIEETVAEQQNKKINANNNKYKNLDFLLELKQKKLNTKPKEQNEKTEDSLDVELKKFQAIMEDNCLENSNIRKYRSIPVKKRVNKCDAGTGTHDASNENDEKEKIKNLKHFGGIETKLQILESYMKHKK